MATDEVNIKIRRSDGPEFLHQTSLDSTVRSFKVAIAHKCSISPDQQRLIYGGHILNDLRTLRSYGLEDGHVVILAPQLLPDSRTNATGGTNGTTNSTRSADDNEGGVSRGSGLGLNGTRWGISDLEQMGQPFNLNPNLMRNSMDRPAMQHVTPVRQIHVVHVMPGTIGNGGSNLSRTRRGRQARNRSTNLSSTISEAIAGFSSPNTGPSPNPHTSTRGLGDGHIVYLVPALAPASRTNAADGINSTTNNAGTPGANDLNTLRQTIERLAGIILDPTLFALENQDPDISQSWRRVSSSLQTLNQIISTNAGLRGMPDLTSHLRSMMQDPLFLSMLTSPEISERFLSILQACLSSLGQQQSTQESSQAGRATDVQDHTNSSTRRKREQVEMLSNMFSGLGTDSLAVPNSSNNVPPEQFSATQLWQLQGMGFLNRQENIRALIATSGNVHEAAEWLMRNSGR